MAALSFRPHDPTDDDALVAWIASAEWPFHVNPRPTAEQVRSWLADGWIAPPDNELWWGYVGDERVAFVLFTDMTDHAPLFDLRIRPAHRGRGHGRAALAWLVEHLFTTRPDFDRIEGQTRRDNVAMRGLFRALGFAKEAHYRQAWPCADGSKQDSIAYGLLRADWRAGTVTPVEWES